MNLKEILLKKQNKQEEKKEEIGNEASPIQQPDKEAFLLYWSYCVTHPFLPSFIRRDLQKFFLGDTCYVINTFTRCSSQDFLEAYLSILPIRNPIHLHLLWILLCDIEMLVPIEYQSQLIEKIKKLDKNSRLP